MRFIIRRKLVKNGFFCYSAKSLFLTLILAALILFPIPAKSSGDSRIAEGAERVLFGVIISVPVMGGGLTSIISYSVYISKSKKSASFWKNFGYLFGGLNIGALCYWQAAADEYYISNESWFRFYFPAHAAISVLDLGFTIWASKLPGKSNQTLSIQPKIMYDSNHQPVVGMSIQVLRW